MKGIVIMTNRKTVIRLMLGLVCSAAILWLGVGCGKEVDPEYPCGQEALVYAQHVREVLTKNKGLIKRQPTFARVKEHFFRDEEGNWSDDYGIVLDVQEKVDQETLPMEDRLPEELEGVPVYFDESPRNYVGGLIEGAPEKHPELQYAAAVMWKHDDLFERRPNRTLPAGYGILGDGGRAGEPLSVQILMGVTDKVRQSLLPPAMRIPECLDGVPVLIFESKSN